MNWIVHVAITKELLARTTAIFVEPFSTTIITARICHPLGNNKPKTIEYEETVFPINGSNDGTYISLIHLMR